MGGWNVRLAALLLGLGLGSVSCGLYAGGDTPSAQNTPDASASTDAPATFDSATDVQPTAFAPSHTSATFDVGATDLVDPTAIDTSKLQLAFGGALANPPAGIGFKDVGGVAVLRVGAWSQQVVVTVSGTRPLLVLASKAVTLSSRVDAAADKATAGPGGDVQQKGAGGGAAGTHGDYCDPGGGGAGFGDLGGRAGVPPCGSATAGAGGPTYGLKSSDFAGGSGGGKGSGSCGGAGGAGGGAIQISSLARIDVVGGGAIGVGGGGGGGGCKNPGNGGGGGGSGGLIFLEAPAMGIDGTLAANGGGGGEGGYNDLFNGRDGQPGTNALLDILPAPGGGALSTDRPGGEGGARAVQSGRPPAKDNIDNTGGGGGAAGRIWLRTRAKPASTPSGRISPAPTLDISL